MESDDIRYGENPIAAEGFAVELRAVKGKGEKFCVVSFRTRYGTAKFILLPEEVQALIDSSAEAIKGIELRGDYVPTVTTSDKRKELFPDI